jgi:hypothetical protein
MLVGLADVLASIKRLITLTSRQPLARMERTANTIGRLRKGYGTHLMARE